MSKLVIKNDDYSRWLLDLKQRIRTYQLRAAVSVNSQLIRAYWELGRDIVEMQAEAQWGKRIYDELSFDLQDAFPGVKGFSITNLKLMKRVYSFYNQDVVIGYQAGTQLESLKKKKDDSITDALDFDVKKDEREELNNLIFLIPWRHQVEIVRKSQSVKEAVFYMQKVISQNWSRSTLMNMLDADLYASQGKALSNFSKNLPDIQGALAQEMTKDPYCFDFITIAEGFKEKELEHAFIDNITKFLLELGSGFAYVGRQVRLEIGEEEFFADLLFYHLKLRCFVVVELKTGRFKAEYVSKLGLYVSAINHQMRHETDKQTIGLLICKSKDAVVAKYTLESTSQPIGISEYQLSKVLSKDFNSSLPSIEEIENELK